MLRLAPVVAALALTAFLFLTTVYRAATQSITIDEAYTYSQFVARPLGAAMSEYDANNHVLYTLLARLSTGMLGASELPLRLPALAGALLFFASLFRLLLRQLTVESRLLLPFGVALVGANTYVLDLLPLARGYGLALGLFTLALALLAKPGAPPVAAGIALGLAVAANLTFLFPAVALAAAIIWLERSAAAWRFAAAAVLSAAPLLALPLSHAGRDHFYFGTDSLANSLASLAGASLTHNWNERGGPVPAGSVIAVAVLAATIVAGLVWRRTQRTLFLLAATIAGSATLLIAAHYSTGLPYPYGRTGLYWILLFGVGLIALAPLHRAAQGIAIGVTLAAVFCYATAWSPRFTTDWQFDAGSREIAERIETLHLHEKDRPVVRVAASDLLAPSLDFYRVTRGWTWMRRVKRGGPEPFDYYVAIGEDREWAEREGLSILLDHPIAGSVLVAPTTTPLNHP